MLFQAVKKRWAKDVLPELDFQRWKMYIMIDSKFANGRLDGRQGR